MDEQSDHNIVDEDVEPPSDPAEDFDWSPAVEEVAGLSGRSYSQFRDGTPDSG